MKALCYSLLPLALSLGFHVPASADTTTANTSSATGVDTLVLALADTKSSKVKGPMAYRTIEWTELIPQADLDALMNPPAYINEIEDGSFEDQISGQLEATISSAFDDRYQQALVSTSVISEMNRKPVRIPGFIVPVEFDEDQTITQFFLVPYFGACIHVPPPPPNQIIFANYPKGLQLEELYTPFWISGVLNTSITQNDMATSAYSISVHDIEIYKE